MQTGQVANLGSGEEIAIRDLVLMIHEMAGSSSELHIGSLEYRPTEIWRMFAANKRAESRLGWTVMVGFAQGLERTIEWYRHFLNQFDDPESPLGRLCSFTYA